MISGILHIHTTFSDGLMDVSRLKSYCLARGLSFACITDHAENISRSRFDDLVRDCESASDSSFVAVPGLEFPVGSAHVLAIGLRGATSRACGIPAIDEASSFGALIVLAHPRLGGRAVPDELLALLDGVEVWNGRYDGGFVPDPQVLAVYRRLAARKPGILGLGGCDLHDPEQRGIIRTSMQAQMTQSSVLSALVSGQYAIRGLAWRLGGDVKRAPLSLCAVRGVYLSAKRLRGLLPALTGRRA